MNIEDFLFALIMLFTAGAYLSQSYKVYNNRSSHGVSWQAYLISMIGVLTMAIYSQNNHVTALCLIESALILLTLILILVYGESKPRSIGKTFFVAITCSLFMVRGVMQAIESSNHTGRSQVSITGYMLWIALNCALLILAESYYVISGLAASTIIFAYIIYRTIVQNKNNPQLCADNT